MRSYLSMQNFLPAVAHRGLHGEGKPENSLPAFRAAAEAGYPIETDVRFTKEKEIVVFHDDTLLRMTGDPRAVGECTLAELEALRLGGTEERIPTLRAFLAEVGGRVPLLIEIKNMNGVKGEEIARALSEGMKGYAGEYAVQSFQPFYVKAYKELCPSVPCGMLVAADTPVSEFAPPFAHLKRRLVTRLSLLNKVRPDFVSFSFRAIPKRAEKFKGTKFAWTVRSEADRALARQSADAIIFENFIPS